MTKTRDQLEQEVKECYAQYTAKKKELKNFKVKALREYYGPKASCDTCRYSCSLFVGDPHTDCLKNKCIHCEGFCEYYAPTNKFSDILHERYPYKPNVIDAIESLFDVHDILSQEQLHDKVIKILDIVRAADNE